MTTYTAATKQILRDDIVFIDQQLTLARNKMSEGDKAEAWSIFDSLLGYYDFKKHFPDIFVNGDESIRFRDFYEVLHDIDDIIEIDAIQMLTQGNALEWRPGHSRDEILHRLRAFLQQIERWKALGWFEGDDIIDSLELLKEKVQAFIRFFQNYDGGYLFRQVIDVREAKKGLWRSLSETLPFAEIYTHLLTMDRDLLHRLFRFRLHLDDVTLEEVEQTIDEIVAKKHAILAIIDATHAEDESVPHEPPPGWDDLQPFPPPGYAMLGTGIVPVRASRRIKQTITVVGGNYVGVVNTGSIFNKRTGAILGVLGVIFVSVVAATVTILLFTNHCTTG